jgi:hypothetical protein
MKCYRASARALVECEFNLGFAQVKDDSKNKFLLGEAKASVARNLPINFLFHEAQLLKSHLWAGGTVK